MLMTNNPPPKSLTAQGEHILEFLRQRGDWTTRAQIAEYMGKNRLNKWDVGLLELMIDRGLIDFNRRPRPDGTTLEFVYRVKE